MLEVAFDNGVAGGLRIAKGSHPGDKRFCITAPIYPKDTPPEQREAPRQETRVWQGADLGGSAEDVALLELALDMGDLSGLADMDLKKRRKVLEDLYSPPPADREDAHEKYLEKVWNTSVKTLERLRNTGGAPVRMWAAPWCPGDLCGVYAVCHLLQHGETPLFVVWAPQEALRRGGREMEEIRGLGELDPEQFGALAASAIELTPIQRRVYASRWLELVQENAPLRAVVNGRLMSVPEDFYDFVLRKAMPPEPIKMGEVLAKALTALPGVGDGWLYRRLRAMIAAGAVQEISPGNGRYPPYTAVIRRMT